MEVTFDKGGGCLGDDVKYLRIGELAETAGLSSRTIDYYTQIGLIHEASRSPGKHRLYSEETLKTLTVIRELQKQHYSLHEICQLFDRCRSENGDIFEKTANIRRCLDSLQKEVNELYPSVLLSAPGDQAMAISKELIKKSIEVLQALIIILGDPML